MNFILFDDSSWHSLLPLTFTRPVCEIRVGVFTIKEKWLKHLQANDISYRTQTYLKVKFPIKLASRNLLICGAVLPDKLLAERILRLKSDEALYQNEELIAVNLSGERVETFNYESFTAIKKQHFDGKIRKISHPWHIFMHNAEEIENDIHLLEPESKSSPISHTNNIIAPENVYAAPGAKVEYATINASAGPVYLGRDSEVMEGSVIRGPFSLGEHSVLKLLTKIYGATSIGPHCKIGGEVNNCSIIGFSNKAHDGFLGNSVLGEWCNIGADSNNSNLKNNYANVKLWNYQEERFIDTGLQFCGLIMGDHSKCGINTMFNTGTVVGISANIFGSGFPRNFIPSFSWGGASGFKDYKLERALEVAELVMKRRNISLSQADRDILLNVYQSTKKYRK